MLRITIPGVELWDEVNEEFTTTKPLTIQLEHSLVSLSKWEAKWHKPFLSKDGLTEEQTIDYIRCMTLTQNVDPSAYSRLTNQNIKEINDYIDNPMTATWFNDSRKKQKRSNEQVTSELIYYWMTALNVPMECQKWHLNRLLTLIQVCNIKNQPSQKMPRREQLSQQAALNEVRRKMLKTRG